MNPSIPDKMKAAAIDRFGGPEVIQTRSLPVPKPGPWEVLIRLDTAGIGVWDPYVRAGELSSGAPTFPQVIGNDGAVNEDNVAPIPPGVSLDEAGALGADGVTALRGLQDELRLAAGETLMV